MTDSTKKARSSETLNIRIRPEQRELIDTAANVCGKTRTSFILDSVCQAAENILLDRQVFVVDNKQWEEFNRALDTPPKTNPKLSAILTKKAPWES